RGISARPERKGIQTDGRSGNATDRCLEDRDWKRSRPFRDRAKNRNARKSEVRRCDRHAGRSDRGYYRDRAGLVREEGTKNNPKRSTERTTSSGVTGC